jgi:hypothetical protein
VKPADWGKIKFLCEAADWLLVSAINFKKMANNNNGLNISQPQIPIFKGENYGFWSIKMKTLFLS